MFLRPSSPLKLLSPFVKAFLIMRFIRCISLAAALGAASSASPDVSPALQKMLDQAHQGPLYDYPTSFTQGIIPVRFQPTPSFHCPNHQTRKLIFKRKQSIPTMTTGAMSRSTQHCPMV